MVISDRLRAVREQKSLSQEDIEKRTGLLRCYISGVENGETVPAIETLEKLARALEVPLYQLFYDGEETPQFPKLPKRLTADDIAWGGSGSRAKLAWNGAQGMRDHVYNGLNDSTIRQGISFHRNWAYGGDAVDLHCPNCNSTDLKKLSLVYQEGTSRTNVRTRLRGVVVGSDGPDFVVGSGATKGIQQTAISKAMAPPTKWSYTKLAGWSVLGFFSVGWLVFYVNTVTTNSQSVLSLPLATYVVVAFCGFAGAFAEFWRHNHSTYARKFARWDRTFICGRCGTVSEEPANNPG